MKNIAKISEVKNVSELEDTSGIFESIEIYSRKRNLLERLILDVQTNGIVSPAIERELSDAELGDVINELNAVPKGEAIRILRNQIEKYEQLIRGLMK